MENIFKITKRLKGLSFEQVGETEWVRRDCPNATRTGRSHRRYGWWRGALVVRLQKTFVVEQPLWNGKSRVLGTFEDLASLVAFVETWLKTSRTRGRRSVWWNQPVRVPRP